MPPRSSRVLLGLALLIAALTFTAAPASAAGVTVVRDTAYSTVEGQTLRLDTYYPPTWSAGRPAVILVHGGAWSGGDKSTMSWVGEQLASNGIVAIAINYRLQSATPWPSEINDVQTAIRFVRSRAAVAGIDPARIGILGDSAGGNLAALAATAGSGSWSTDARVRAVVAFSGIFDLNTLIPQVQGDPVRGWLQTAVASYTGCPALSLATSCVGARWVASPISYLDATDPATLLVDAASDLIPSLQATTMTLRLALAGVQVEHTTIPVTGHGNGLFDDAWPQTLDFLRRTL
jgi:acetyl esterase